MATISEVDLVIKYAGKKGGSESGQLVIDDVELSQSRDNRIRHGIGNSDPQQIEKGNNEYTFSTTTHMGDAAAKALTTIADGNATDKTIYIRRNGVFEGRAAGMVFNDLTVSSSDGGDTTVSIDADLLDITWKDSTEMS